LAQGAYEGLAEKLTRQASNAGVSVVNMMR